MSVSYRPNENTSLRDYPYVVIRFRCHVCQRGGDGRLAILARNHGPGALVGELLRLESASLGQGGLTMSKWLERLREHERNRTMAGSGTDKTDKSHPQGVSSVLSVRSQRDSVNFSETALMPAENVSALYEERAAMLEYDCGLPREEAERFARMQISVTRHERVGSLSEKPAPMISSTPPSISFKIFDTIGRKFLPRHNATLCLAPSYIVIDNAPGRDPHDDEDFHWLCRSRTYGWRIGDSGPGPRDDEQGRAFDGTRTEAHHCRGTCEVAGRDDAVPGASGLPD